MKSVIKRPMLVIGLDGLEVSYAKKLILEGEMPALKGLQDRSASYYLEHGPAQRTGLAWEHVSSGLSPDAANRASVIEFDPKTYRVWQEGSQFIPCLGNLSAKIAVFDPPYLDLKKAPSVQGVVGWGAHDPGVELQASSAQLLQEFQEKVGDYPSSSWIYEFPCYSAEMCRQMGRALVKAINCRQEAALWLLKDKFSTCDLFYVVTGEIHSAIEGLWHGIDPNHPMYSHESAVAASEALVAIHRAVDGFVAALIEASPERDVLAFAMGGMGANQSDLQSMFLLPELLFRHSFNRQFLQVPDAWTQNPAEVPTFSECQNWHSPYNWMQPINRIDRWRNTFNRKFSRATRKYLPFLNSRFTAELYWQPPIYYQYQWRHMDAFALPSFYDGRIRLNVAGRERSGKIHPKDYKETCQRLEAMIRECRDPRTGEAVVDFIEYPNIDNPMELGRNDADLIVVWKGTSNAFTHPQHGVIGPVPFRRTGGHTGPYGVAWIQSSDLPQGPQGVRSSFDVIPTIADLVGESFESEVSGTSFLEKPLVGSGERK
jgi:predicted AlkP superfamily phosphohydrolase/phosphomutase